MKNILLYKYLSQNDKIFKYMGRKLSKKREEHRNIYWRGSNEKHIS
jgi:hypothetical protein